MVSATHTHTKKRERAKGGKEHSQLMLPIAVSASHFIVSSSAIWPLILNLRNHSCFSPFICSSICPSNAWLLAMAKISLFSPSFSLSLSLVLFARVLLSLATLDFHFTLRGTVEREKAQCNHTPATCKGSSV